jgi:hypothetical protein
MFFRVVALGLEFRLFADLLVAVADAISPP